MQSRLLFSLALSILISFVKVEVSSGRIRASYQEDCNATVRCDSRQALTCRDGICECLMNETMTFDKDKKSCVVLVGEKCSFTALEIDNSERNGSTQEKMWKEDLTCVPNAKCSPKGFCGCEDLFMESSKGGCQPKLLYGYDCKSSSECRQDLHLICQDWKCHCNPAYSIFNNLKGTCVTKAGANCEKLQICTGNSQCDFEKGKNYPHNRISNEKKCICNAGLYSAAQGTCERKKKYGELCDKSDACVEDLDLICGEDKTCGCNPSKAVYNKQSKSCVILPGSLCVDSYKRAHELGRKQCVGGAVCESNDKWARDVVNDYGYYQRVCRCSSDTYQTLNRTCEQKRGFHESCSNSKECSNQGKFPLQCVSGKCQCSGKGIIHDPIKKKCVISHNTECPSGSSDDCVWNAECFYDRNRGYKYYCKCLSGTTPTKGGPCWGSHGTRCGKDSAPCNKERGLICQDKQCQCALGEHQEFSTESQSCITLVRGPCGKNFSSSQCVPHAECVEIKGKHECRCKEGFLPVDRKCELGYGEKCANVNTICDSLGGLKCIEGSCKCGVNQVYEKEKLRCRGQVGSMCDLRKDEFCEDGAVCKPFRARMPNRGICSPLEVSFETKSNQISKNVTMVSL